MLSVANTSEFTNDSEACAYEERQVHAVYEAIAPHFSDTRYKPWPTIEKFLARRSAGSIGLDIGAGNGKYLGLGGRRLFLTGLDRSCNLVAIAAGRGFDALVGDALDLPYRDASFDFALSIAVLHHFSTQSRRIAGIRSMLRVLRPGGHLLIQVWALEQGDETALSRRKEEGDATMQQDVLVPWKRRDGAPQEKRYYHLFTKGELASLADQAGAVEVRESWVRGNWVVESRKPCMQV